MDVGAVAGQTDAMGRVVAGVWAGAPGNVRRGEMERPLACLRSSVWSLLIIQVGDKVIKYYVEIF